MSNQWRLMVALAVWAVRSSIHEALWPGGTVTIWSNWSASRAHRGRNKEDALNRFLSHGMLRLGCGSFVCSANGTYPGIWCIVILTAASDCRRIGGSGLGCQRCGFKDSILVLPRDKRRMRLGSSAFMTLHFTETRPESLIICGFWKIDGIPYD